MGNCDWGPWPEIEEDNRTRYGDGCIYGAYADTAAATQSSVKNVFIRGSVVRYVHLPAAAVDTALLEDATRRGESGVCDSGWRSC